MTDPAIIDQIVALIKRASEQEIAVAIELAKSEYQRGFAEGRATQKRETLAFLSDNSVNTARLQMPDPVKIMAEAGLAIQTVPRGWERVIQQARPASERKRAPKGMVRSLVTRALARSTVGLTPQGILDNAESDLERMVKAASVRSELRSGLRSRYYESRGQWFLIKSDGYNVETGGASSRTDPPLLEQ